MVPRIYTAEDFPTDPDIVDADRYGAEDIEVLLDAAEAGSYAVHGGDPNFAPKCRGARECDTPGTWPRHADKSACQAEEEEDARMGKFVLPRTEAILEQRRAAIRTRWTKDRKGLSHHVDHVVRRAHLLTGAERAALVDRLATLGIATEGQKGDTTAA